MSKKRKRKREAPMETVVWGGVMSSGPAGGVMSSGPADDPAQPEDGAVLSDGEDTAAGPGFSDGELPNPPSIQPLPGLKGQPVAPAPGGTPKNQTAEFPAAADRKGFYTPAGEAMEFPPPDFEGEAQEAALSREVRILTEGRAPKPEKPLQARGYTDPSLVDWADVPFQRSAMERRDPDPAISVLSLGKCPKRPPARKKQGRKLAARIRDWWDSIRTEQDPVLPAEPEWSPQMPDLFSLQAPVRIHGTMGRMACATIGKRDLMLLGVRDGRKLAVHSEDILHWGLEDGPEVTPEEKDILMGLLSIRTKPSPWLRLVFLEGGEVIRFDRYGKRKKRRTGRTDPTGGVERPDRDPGCGAGAADGLRDCV